MIQRILKNRILKSLKPQKVIGLFGARRTGKTWLMNDIFQSLSGKKILQVQGDDLDTAEILSSGRLSVLKSFTKGLDYLFIDEAQMIPNIGQNLKLIADQVEGLSVFITGSSALDLKEQTGEPLTGRASYFYMHPFSLSELSEDYLTLKTNLDQRMIYGLYPQVCIAQTADEKREILESLRNGYLLKDILSVDNRKDPVFLLKLLRLLTFQIGNDVSLNELASNMGVNHKIVKHYLDLLEKCFIIFSLPGFSRNLRKEYTQSPRYFFWDNGVRNSLINAYSDISLRDDTGKLWENFIIAERIKKTMNEGLFTNHFFWRTYDRQEIDLIEEHDGNLQAFECKLSKSKTRIPRAFSDNYPGAQFHLINKENFSDFIL
jgi:uncharacterized protein